MKKTIIVAFVGLFISLTAFSQMSFNVSPGLGIQGAHFGFKAGSVQPYVGFQYLGGSYINKETGEEWDSDEGEVVDYEDQTKVSVNVYMPTVGVKVYMGSGAVQPYLNFTASKPIIRGKMQANGEESPEFAEELKKIKVLSGAFAFGAEYFVDDNFSIGGEFGVRYLGGKYQDTYESSFWNPDEAEYQDTEITTTQKVMASPTYTVVTLTYFFGGGSGD